MHLWLVLRDSRGGVDFAAYDVVVVAMILVVDDDADLRRLLDRELQAAGYRVTQSASGAEAIERARRHQPTLVLLDLNLPDLDGIEVLRAAQGDAGDGARAACCS